MKAPLSVIAIASLIVVPLAQSQQVTFLNAGLLHTQLQDAARLPGPKTMTVFDSGQAMAGIGFVDGVADSFNGTDFCLPNPVRRNEVDLAVLKYLDDHPDEWRNRAAPETVLALKARYPCQKK
jgi:hypothetical protein